MLVLTLGMGLGRFLYTPMLPVMLAEGEFTFSELSWIASGNYAGYLAGSLLFSFGAFHLPSRLRPFLLASALATGLLILAMAWLPPFHETLTRGILPRAVGSFLCAEIRTKRQRASAEFYKGASCRICDASKNAPKQYAAIDSEKQC